MSEKAKTNENKLYAHADDSRQSVRVCFPRHFYFNWTDRKVSGTEMLICINLHLKRKIEIKNRLQQSSELI